MLGRYISLFVDPLIIWSFPDSEDSIVLEHGIQTADAQREVAPVKPISNSVIPAKRADQGENMSVDDCFEIDDAIIAEILAMSNHEPGQTNPPSSSTPAGPTIQDDLSDMAVDIEAHRRSPCDELWEAVGSFAFHTFNRDMEFSSQSPRPHQSPPSPANVRQTSTCSIKQWLDMHTVIVEDKNQTKPLQ